MNFPSIKYDSSTRWCPRNPCFLHQVLFPWHKPAWFCTEFKLWKWILFTTMTISAIWHNLSSFHSILHKFKVHSYLCFAHKKIPHKIWHNLAYCGTICHSKISSLEELFLFLIPMSKVLNLLCFFSTQIDHWNGQQTIIKLWTSESHSALWHNLAQFNSIWHPVHY